MGNGKIEPKVNYQTALEKVSESMIRFKRPEHLVKMIVRMIDRQAGVMHTAVLLYREQRNSFVLIDSRGEDTKRVLIGEVELPADNQRIPKGLHE